ncbi:MAG: hypothetical protein V2I35_11105 [Desulfocapsaceae bacterium]|jgi:hypothetical protein|nr:hypothetical protein [Desulfocapsaceae bacterium]
MMEETGRDSLQWNIFAVFLCVLACSYYYIFFMDRAQVHLEIEVSQKTHFKIYWADEKKQFSEKNSAAHLLSPTRTTYDFSIPRLKGYTWLRFDPIHYSGEAVVKSISLSRPGYESITVNFDALLPANQIDDMKQVSGGALRFLTSGTDPYFLYPLAFEKVSSQWPRHLLMMALISLIIVFVAACCSPLRADFAFVPIMLAMALVLIMTMAQVSARNVHPDEYVHLAATEYYKTNWLPPAIEDGAIEDTYSVYGVSRLNNGEIYYLLAGKAALFFETLNIPKLLSLRLFNVSLFALIVLYSIYSVPARAVALPFLISPEVWYVYSYCTSDAFALFICFLAACELVRPASILNRALESESLMRRIVPVLVLSLLLGMLFLLKKNYYPFIVLFYICLFWRIFSSEDEPSSRLSKIFPIIMITVLALGFAGIRMGMDYYVNGHDRQEKILAMQEKTAGDNYKPSTPLSEKPIGLYKKARGIPLKSLIVKDKWFAKTFNTGFGMYGYFTIAGPQIYYQLARWFALALLIYVFAIVVVRGSTGDHVLAAAVVMLSIALIGVSLHHSWTMDFQAQGRYLFPILSMFGVLLGRCRTFFGGRVSALLISQLYFLGLCSFIFIAIMNIPHP